MTRARSSAISSVPVFMFFCVVTSRLTTAWSTMRRTPGSLVIGLQIHGYRCSRRMAHAERSDAGLRHWFAAAQRKHLPMPSFPLWPQREFLAVAPPQKFRSGVSAFQPRLFSTSVFRTGGEYRPCRFLDLYSSISRRFSSGCIIHCSWSVSCQSQSSVAI